MAHCGITSGDSPYDIMLTAAKAAGESDLGRKGADGGLGKLPDHPGEDAFAHQGKLWIEQAERVLAGLRLLGVANGEEPNEAKAIKIFPLDRIPPLPSSHHYYEKRRMERLEKMVSNEEKIEKRLALHVEHLNVNFES